MIERVERLLDGTCATLGGCDPAGALRTHVCFYTFLALLRRLWEMRKLSEGVRRYRGVQECRPRGASCGARADAIAWGRRPVGAGRTHARTHVWVVLACVRGGI